MEDNFGDVFASCSLHNHFNGSSLPFDFFVQRTGTSAYIR